jgi:RHS repeat-associated protein
MNRPVSLSSFRSFTLIGFLSFVVSAATAQVTQLSDATASPVHGAGHNYEGMLNETVSPATGALDIHIDLPVAPGRKLTVPLGIEYNSGQAWFLARRSQYAPSCIQGNGQCPHPQGYAVSNAASGTLTWGGWSATFPEVTYQNYSQNAYANLNVYNYPCEVYTAFMLKDASGSSHQLNLSHLLPSYQSACIGTNPKLVEADTAADDFYESSLPFTNGQPNGGSGFPLVAGPDGTVYTFGNVSFVNDKTIGSLPNLIEDRNGNIANISSSASPGQNILSVTDTLGRNEITISQWGIAGGTSSVNVAGEPYSLTWQSVNPSGMPISITSDSWSGAYGCISPPNIAGANNPGVPLGALGTYAVSALTLPNGRQYMFTYDPVTGFISKITYPSGGYVSYTWGKNSRSTGIGFNDQNGQMAGCAYLYDTPAITQRSVSFDGSTIALQQTFSYTTNWGLTNGTLPAGGTWNTKTTTVTTTDLIAGTTSKTVYTYGWIYAPLPISYLADNQSGFTNQSAVENTVQHYGYSQSYPLLKTDTKGWYLWSNPARMLCSFETLGNGLTSGKFYAYGNGGQITDVKEYDFGQLSASACSSNVTLPTSLPVPTRETATTYQSFAALPTFATSPSLFDRPATVQIFDGSSGNSVLFSETDISYDQTTVSPVSSLTTGTHDESGYPSSVKSPRGNATTVTRKCFQGGCPGNSITTYAYDETGQVISMTDPCGNGTCADVSGSSHTTTYSYANTDANGVSNLTVLSGGQNTSYTPSGSVNAYLTGITDALGHSSIFKYDFNNGQLTQSTDPNSQSTTYVYNDVFFRPTQFNFPDGGQQTIAYNDSSFSTVSQCTTSSLPTPNVTTTTLISSSPLVNMVNTVGFDGMGHKVEKILQSDPSGPDCSNTTYYGMGADYQVTNPHRQASGSTDGTTTYAYDGLGRTTTVTTQDGSVASTAYDQTIIGVNNATCTTVTDEAGKARQSCVDGLGRKIGVWEDPLGLKYETDYTYDILGSLTYVNQKGSNSSNARTRTFSYDSLSRLTSATNPESGTITYAYDLNSNLATRVAPKEGQTGTALTTHNYAYDVGNRLVKESHLDPNGETEEYAYDGVALTAGCGQSPPTITSTNAIGRRSAMCGTRSGSGWSFDPMGRPLLESTRNLGSAQKVLSINYTYYKDGSLNTLAYPSGDVVTYTVGGAGRVTQVTDSTNNFVTAATYAPPGLLTGMTNGSGIVTSNIYNDRLQPVLLSAGVTGQSAIFSLCYDFHLHVAISNSPCSFSAYTSGNNGNVFQVLNNVDTTRSAVFAYDSLNRIAQANTVNTTSSNCWGEVYSIDSWGNLYGRAGAPGMAGNCTTELLGATATTKNQLGGNGMLYDAAGNVTNDGLGNTPTYDAEDRIATVAGFTYYYDAAGTRMEKTTGSSGTIYWMGPSGALTETDLAGTINAEYIFFNGQRIARVDRPSGTVHYYFSDMLHSATVIASASGAVQERCFYYPYGGQQSCTGSDPNHYKFTGKERDSESNLDEFGARYYASSTGRFMTPDWAARPTNVPYAEFGDPQTLNLYTYVENAPLNRVDADGHGGDCVKTSKGDPTGTPTCDPPKPPAQTTTQKTVAKVIEVANRTSAAVTGAANAALGVIKVHTAIGIAEVAPATGPGAAVAAVTAPYLAINGTGQTMSGLASLTYAATGNKDAQDASEVFTAATTISGMGTLAVTGGNFKAAATVGSIENMVPSLAGGNPSPEKALEFFTGLVETAGHMLDAGSTNQPQKPPDPAQ